MKFLNDFLVTKGKPTASIPQFNKFFEEIDLNKDGMVSKQEMARFVRLYMTPNRDDTLIEDLTNKLFMKFDVNRSGYLDKREVLAMLDEILLSKNRPKTTIPQFNRFFAEYDVNGDGVISKAECAKFVKKFLDESKNLSIQDKASSLMMNI